MLEKIKSFIFKNKDDGDLTDFLNNKIKEVAIKDFDNNLIIDDILTYQTTNKNEHILQLICKNGEFVKKVIIGLFEYYIFKVKDMYYYVTVKTDELFLNMFKGRIQFGILCEYQQLHKFDEKSVSKNCCKIFKNWIEKTYPISEYPYYDKDGNILDDWNLSDYEKEVKFLEG